MPCPGVVSGHPGQRADSPTGMRTIRLAGTGTRLRVIVPGLSSLWSTRACRQFPARICPTLAILGLSEGHVVPPHQVAVRAKSGPGFPPPSGPSSPCFPLLDFTRTIGERWDIHPGRVMSTLALSKRASCAVAVPPVTGPFHRFVREVFHHVVQQLPRGGQVELGRRIPEASPHHLFDRPQDPENAGPVPARSQFHRRQPPDRPCSLRGPQQPPWPRRYRVPDHGPCGRPRASGA